MGAPISAAASAVNVEYVSANPTGPMHVGPRPRRRVRRCALQSPAFTGYDVTREYYVNDAGAQVDALARSAYLRYREALGEDIGEIPAGLYPGDYLKPVGQALARPARTLRSSTLPEERWLPLVRDGGHRGHAGDDQGRSRRAQHSPRRLLLRALAHGAARTRWPRPSRSCARRASSFEGRLEKPKGHDDADWEDREQTLFRSTAFGDDVDRALMKSDGSYTYFASDMAYHHNKLERAASST